MLQQIQKHPGWSFVYLLVLVNAGFQFYFLPGQRNHLVTGFFLQQVFIFGAVVFVQLFTTLIPDDMQAKNGAALPANNSDDLKRYWLIFSYSFMFFALLVSIYPFVESDKDSGTPRLIYGKADNPISMVMGCVIDEDLAAEIACRTSGLQIIDNNPAVAPSTSAARSLTALTQTQTVQLATNNPVVLQWLVNVGGSVNTCKFPDRELTFYCLNGGVQVPLYFVVVALIGGAISLTRRLPEYQKRSAALYQETPGQPRISLPLMREYLVFQIVQYVSAPFLAFVAYFIISPDSQVSAVIIGFAAGFSSETILVQIRKLLKKFSDSVAAEPEQTGGISGLVLDYITHRGIPGAVIKTGTHQATTDDHGHFVLTGLKPGTITLDIAADGKSVQHKLELPAGESKKENILLNAS